MINYYNITMIVLVNIKNKIFEDILFKTLGDRGHDKLAMQSLYYKRIVSSYLRFVNNKI